MRERENGWEERKRENMNGDREREREWENLNEEREGGRRCLWCGWLVDTRYEEPIDLLSHISGDINDSRRSYRYHRSVVWLPALTQALAYILSSCNPEQGGPMTLTYVCIGAMFIIEGHWIPRGHQITFHSTERNIPRLISHTAAHTGLFKQGTTQASQTGADRFLWRFRLWAVNCTIAVNITASFCIGTLYREVEEQACGKLKGFKLRPPVSLAGISQGMGRHTIKQTGS